MNVFFWLTIVKTGTNWWDLRHLLVFWHVLEAYFERFYRFACAVGIINGNFEQNWIIHANLNKNDLKVKLYLLRKCFERQNPCFHFGSVLRPLVWSSSQCVRCSCTRFVFFSFRSIVSAFRLAWSFVFRWLTGRFSVLRKDLGISSNSKYQLEFKVKRIQDLNSSVYLGRYCYKLSALKFDE